MGVAKVLSTMTIASLAWAALASRTRSNTFKAWLVGDSRYKTSNPWAIAASMVSESSVSHIWQLIPIWGRIWPKFS